MKNIGFEFYEKKKFSYNIMNVINIQIYLILKSTLYLAKNNRTISIYPFITAIINAGILLKIYDFNIINYTKFQFYLKSLILIP